MKAYHGTSLTQAIIIMQGKFKKMPMKTSMGYGFNLTNDIEEAKTHADLSKYENWMNKGAILEFDIETDNKLEIKGFEKDDDKIRNIYKQTKVDLIDFDISNSRDFHVYIAYNPSILKYSKIAGIV